MILKSRIRIQLNSIIYLFIGTIKNLDRLKFFKVYNNIY